MNWWQIIWPRFFFKILKIKKNTHLLLWKSSNIYKSRDNCIWNPHVLINSSPRFNSYQVLINQSCFLFFGSKSTSSHLIYKLISVYIRLKITWSDHFFLCGFCLWYFAQRYINLHLYFPAVFWFPFKKIFYFLIYQNWTSSFFKYLANC